MTLAPGLQERRGGHILRRVQRVRVKIEGLRDSPTALGIARMGADAIGMVFADSPRRIGAERAAEIVGALPPWVATVGVFVNAAPDEINRIVEQAGIGYVQLHGDEEAEIVGQIAQPCIKAFRVRDENWVSDVRAWLDGVADRSNLAAVLLDAYNPSVCGGTGERFNWRFVFEARSAGELDDIGPLILAGGLDAACVAEAIRIAQPWAVDVASGVESAPGVKDLAKVEKFLRAVQGTGES